MGNMLPEAARTMALIGKPRGKRDLRKRHIGARQQLLGALKPPPCQIVVRRNPERLLERTQEVPDREIGQPRQGPDLDPLAKVAVDILAHLSHYARWQPAAQISTLRLDRPEHGDLQYGLPSTKV